MLRVLILLCILFTTGLAEASRESGKIVGSGAKPPVFNLTEPKGGWTVDRMIQVSGIVSDSSIDPVKVIINGSRYYIRVSSTDGSFKRKFPAFPGKNSVIVSGSNKGGTGKAVKSIFSLATQVPITAILTSDTDGIYTDLHIYEPEAGVKNPFDKSTKLAHVFWAATSSPSGGKFYLNEQSGSYDQPGYGPYMYTHVAPPIGFYRIDANYWPSGDKAHALANLDLILNGGKPDEIHRQIKAPLAKPGETVTLAWIRYEKDGHAFVYSPSADPKPRDNKLWPQWLVDFKAPKDSGGYGETGD